MSLTTFSNQIYNIELCEWPSYGFDFNAAKLFWNIINRKLNKKSKGRT